MSTNLVGGQKPPFLDCSGGHVYGGRPKAAIDHAAPRRASEGRPGSFQAFQAIAATQQKTLIFRFRLGRLWRALISSIYIY